MFPFELTVNGNPGGGILSLVVILMTIVNFMMAVFWIVVGWRAMKAHERLPETLAANLNGAEASRSHDGEPPIPQA